MLCGRSGKALRVDRKVLPKEIFERAHSDNIQEGFARFQLISILSKANVRTRACMQISLRVCDISQFTTLSKATSQCLRKMAVMKNNDNSAVRSKY